MPTNKTHFGTTTGTGNEWVQDRYYANLLPTGNIYWVCSSSVNAGDTTTRGYSPEAPFATLNYAISRCNADSNDTIVVLSGHTETIIAAAGVALNKAGVTIVGQGDGRQRPKINYTTAISASFDVTAARCTVRNLAFTMTGFNALTAGINVTASDFTLDGCEIEFANSTNQAVLALLTSALADRMTIKNCFVHGSSNAGTAAALRVVGGDSITILDNVIIGNFTTTLGGIDNATTAATNLIISRNSITNRTAVATVAINAQAATTGQITNNRLSILSGTAPVVAAGINMALGNAYTATAGVTAGVASNF